MKKFCLISLFLATFTSINAFASGGAVTGTFNHADLYNAIDADLYSSRDFTYRDLFFSSISTEAVPYKVLDSSYEKYKTWGFLGIDNRRVTATKLYSSSLDLPVSFPNANFSLKSASSNTNNDPYIRVYLVYVSRYPFSVNASTSSMTGFSYFNQNYGFTSFTGSQMSTSAINNKNVPVTFEYVCGSDGVTPLITSNSTGGLLSNTNYTYGTPVSCATLDYGGFTPFYVIDSQVQDYYAIMSYTIDTGRWGIGLSSEDSTILSNSTFADVTTLSISPTLATYAYSGSLVFPTFINDTLDTSYSNSFGFVGLPTRQEAQLSSNGFSSYRGFVSGDFAYLDNIFVVYGNDESNITISDFEDSNGSTDYLTYNPVDWSRYEDEDLNWLSTIALQWINPFAPLFNLFTDNSSCVDITTLAGMIGSSETQYCPWFPSSVRNILTPVIGIFGTCLAFGFFVHWLNKGDV